MTSANDNSNRWIDVDCFVDGGDPYLMSVFDKSRQPEPIVSELFDEADDAMAAAQYYAEVYGITRINDMTGVAP